jgi:hypothetical protein
VVGIAPIVANVMRLVVVQAQGTLLPLTNVLQMLEEVCISIFILKPSVRLWEQRVCLLGLVGLTFVRWHLPTARVTEADVKEKVLRRIILL